jgi:hypothetical protein
MNVAMDSLIKWFETNWFQGVQTFGIIAGFLISSWSMWKSTQARKISNYLLLTQYHRDIWGMTLEKPELNRIRTLYIDLDIHPITQQERQFILFVMLHASCAFEMQKNSQLLKIEALKADINGFLEYPIPKKVWDEIKTFFNESFVSYVGSYSRETPKRF